MKKFYLWTLLCLMVGMSACSSDEPGGGESKPTQVTLSRSEEDGVMMQNDFAFRLLDRLSATSDEANVMVSPVSVVSYLSLLAECADAEEADKIYTALGYDSAVAGDVIEANNQILTAISTTDKKVKCTIASSVWVDKDLDLQPGFMDWCSGNKAIDASVVDLRSDQTISKINKWVAGKTNNRITRLASEVMGLDVFFANAVYFDGLFSSPFDVKKTITEQFTNEDGVKTDVSMMHSKCKRPCWKDDTEKAVDMIFGNGSYSAIFVLPNEGVTVAQSIASFDAKKLTEWRQYLFDNNQMCISTVNLHLPKFEMSYDKDLSGALGELGLDDIFLKTVNMPMISSKPIALGDINQALSFKIDEKGVEAAAVTYNSGATSPGPIYDDPTREIDLNFDRPFYYWVEHNPTGAILFMGVVNRL